MGINGFDVTAVDYLVTVRLFHLILGRIHYQTCRLEEAALDKCLDLRESWLIGGGCICGLGMKGRRKGRRVTNERTSMTQLVA